MHHRMFALALAIATACSPLATDQKTPQPTPTLASPTSAAPSPTLSAASPTASPDPTPIARTISGRAAFLTGAGVAGVQIRGMPMPLENGRAPGADVTAVTDARGAYSLSVMTWTPEALAKSGSYQLMVQVTPPEGLLVLGVRNALGGLPGSANGNFNGPLILSDLSGPIDVILGQGHVIEGRVTSGLTGAPLAGTNVLAIGPNSILIYGGQGDAFDIAATASTDSSGTYRLTVPSGIYAIYTSGLGALTRFWSDDPAVFQASRITVERNVAGIDITVVPVTQIGGYVRSGPSFADGVEGARVAAYVAGGTCCRLVGLATSGYNGTFVMYLPPGTYRFVFDPPTGSPYAAQWWRAAAGFATATDVTVGPDRVELVVELPRK